MSPSRIAAITLRQYYLLRGNMVRLLPMVGWVAIDILLWGFITRYLSRISAAGFGLAPAILGAVLLWDFSTRVMQGITTAFFEDVWSRNFMNVFATPLRVSEYLLGLVITGVTTSLFGLASMLLLATTVFGLSFFIYGLALIPFVLVLFLFGIALGVFGAAIVLRLGPASEWLIWPIPAILSPFVGVFYPLSTLPVWMQGIGRLLAPSYVFEGMRAIVAGKGASMPLLAVGCVLAAAYLALAGTTFTLVYRYAIRTGLIARYSAESIG